MAVGLPEGPSYPGHSPFIFSLCCPLNDRRMAAHSIFKIGRLFSLFFLSCLTLALLRLLILLLLLMSGNVHPNPGPIFPCSVCAGNVTWRGKSVQCCACSKWVHLRCSQLSLSNFRALGSSHSWSCPPCRNTVTPPSSDSSGTYTSTVESGPPSANAALLPHPRLQTSYPPSAHLISPSPALPPPSLAPGYTSAPPASSPPPDSLRVLQWNAGALRARSTELLHFLSSHPVDLICIQESNLNSSSSFRIPGFSVLRSDCTHSRSGILSSDASHASGGVVIFVRQGLYFSELSTTSLSSLDPYSDYVGVNISLNKSSSVSFLNVYAPPIRSSTTDGRTDSFSPSILPSSRNLFILGDFNCHHPLWDSRGTSDPVGRKYSTGSSPQTSSPSMTLTHPPFSIAPLAVAPLLTSPLLLLLLLFLAPGRCFRTWVLTTYQFFYLSLSLRSFAPMIVPLPSIFRKLAGMTLPPTLTILLQRNTRRFLFPLQLLSLPLWQWMRPNLPFLSAASNALLKLGGLLRWNKRLVKDAGLSLLLTEVMKIARLTSPPLDVPRQSLPRPRLRHGRRPALLFHLNLILNLCTLFFALSLALLPPLLTFLTVLLPGNRLRFMPLTWGLTFPFLSQRPCAAEPEATSLSSAEPRALWSFTRPFALPSLPLNFLRLPSTSPHPLPLVQTKLPISC